MIFFEDGDGGASRDHETTHSIGTEDPFIESLNAHEMAADRAHEVAEQMKNADPNSPDSEE